MPNWKGPWIKVIVLLLAVFTFFWLAYVIGTDLSEIDGFVKQDESTRLQLLAGKILESGGSYALGSSILLFCFLYGLAFFVSSIWAFLAFCFSLMAPSLAVAVLALIALLIFDYMSGRPLLDNSKLGLAAFFALLAKEPVDKTLKELVKQHGKS